MMDYVQREVHILAVLQSDDVPACLKAPEFLDQTPVLLLSQVLVLLYSFCKCRGYKTIGQCSTIISSSDYRTQFASCPTKHDTSRRLSPPLRTYSGTPNGGPFALSRTKGTLPHGRAREDTWHTPSPSPIPPYTSAFIPLSIFSAVRIGGDCLQGCPTMGRRLRLAYLALASVARALRSARHGGYPCSCCTRHLGDCSHGTHRRRRARRGLNHRALDIGGARPSSCPPAPR